MTSPSPKPDPEARRRARARGRREAFDAVAQHEAALALAQARELRAVLWGIGAASLQERGLLDAVLDTSEQLSAWVLRHASRRAEGAGAVVWDDARMTAGLKEDQGGR